MMDLTMMGPEFRLFRPETDAEVLRQYNVHVAASGTGNIVALHVASPRLSHPFTVTFHGAGNVLSLDHDCGVTGSIWFDGSHSRARIEGQQHIAHLEAHLYNSARLHWGQGSRTYGAKIWIHGGRTIDVGPDCLMSDNIRMLTSDHHSIVDLATMEQINYPEDINIGKHVWIGAHCHIKKGVSIGDGAIVATGSIVTKAVPPRELWGGVPAHSIRQNVSWVDSHPAEPGQIEALRDELGLAPSGRSAREGECPSV